MTSFITTCKSKRKYYTYGANRMFIHKILVVNKLSLVLSRHNFRFWKNNKTLWTFFHCKAALDICTIWRRKKLSDETYARQLCVSSFYNCVWKTSNCTFGNPPVKNWFWCYEQSNLINTWYKVTVTPRSKKILKDIFCIVTCSFFWFSFSEKSYNDKIRWKVTIRWKVIRWKVTIRWKAIRWKVIRWKVIWWKIIRWNAIRWKVPEPNLT